jgi:hypothetical protein
MSASKIRVYVGTRKGGYVLESDKARRKWTVRGPSMEGMDIFHIQPDPRHPGTAYAAANNPWLGPMVFRSQDFGKRWTELAPPMMALSKERPPPTEGPPKWPIVNLWHLTPGSADEPKMLLLGVDPGSLFRSDDLGASWEAVRGLNDHATRPKWNPGAGGMCLHTILIDPTRPKRWFAGISAAGTFRSEDAGAHWTPTNRGVGADFLPDKSPEVGQCVHKIALDPGDPSTVYRQDHGGIYVSHDATDSWTHIGKSLPTDFGFVVATAAARPGRAYFVPLDGQTRLISGGRFEMLRWSEKSRSFQRTVRSTKWPGNYGTHREGLAIDAMDPPGLYLGTTTGQLFVSPDGDRSWLQVPYAFPGIHSVEVDTPQALSVSS